MSLVENQCLPFRSRCLQIFFRKKVFLKAMQKCRKSAVKVPYETFLGGGGGGAAKQKYRPPWLADVENLKKTKKNTY